MLCLSTTSMFMQTIKFCHKQLCMDVCHPPIGTHDALKLCKIWHKANNGSNLTFFKLKQCWPKLCSQNTWTAVHHRKEEKWKETCTNGCDAWENNFPSKTLYSLLFDKGGFKCMVAPPNGSFLVIHPGTCGSSC